MRNLGRPSRSDFVQDALCRIRHKLSESMSKTLFPALASPIPKFTVVVVFDTPPFWFAMAMTLHFLPVLSIYPVLLSISHGLSAHSWGYPHIP